MRQRSPIMKTMPFPIVGSSVFGRYPKISAEKTYNMIISDDALVDYAGYKLVKSISSNGEGRGLYVSDKANVMIAVVNEGVYSIDFELNTNLIGRLNTFSGDVFIDENDASQIAICDKSSIWIYNYSASTFTQVTNLGFVPGYICFHNGYFISVDAVNSKWRLSNVNDGFTWNTINTGLFQTKPDMPLAVVRIPGKSNQIFVVGSTCTEIWTNTGAQLFPYQKSAISNIDYGTVNPATIAWGDNIVAWIGKNENSGAAVMISTGAGVQQISTDGINFLLSRMQYPNSCYGFMFKQDGHLIYQFTFYKDNISLIYDFNTGKFFNVSDPYQNAHIAKRVVFFNGTYYFIDFVDGNLYAMNTDYTDYNGAPIPRIRVTGHIALPNSSNFVVNNVTFPLEMGEDAAMQSIDWSVSKDGGESFSSAARKILNPQGYRSGRVDFWRYGAANDFVMQYRFWSDGRFVIKNGECTYYQ